MRKIKLRKAKSLITINECYEGDCIEEQIRKKMAGEEIQMTGKALLYTERKEGVLPITNIRTDRWEIAQNAVDVRERSRATMKVELNKKEANKGVQNPDGAQSTEA